MSAVDAAVALRDALEDVDNPTGAARALARLTARLRPEYRGQVDALRWAAEQQLAPFFDGDRRAAKAVAWATIDTALRRHGARTNPPATDPAPAHDGEGDVVLLRDVEPETVRWLWPGRVPLGKLTILDGDPGLGKSTLTLDLAARLSRGDPMPDDASPDLQGGPAGTVLLTVEDGLADTVRPRLDAGGADCARVAALKLLTDPETGRARLPTVADLTAIEDAIDRVEARLVVIDPLVAYLGEGTNSHRDQDVRGALAGLAELADRRGVAVVAVRHLNKTSSGNPLYRGGGSIGLIGAARSGLLVAADPEDETGERRILAATKSNLAAPPPSLAFRLRTAGGAVLIGWQGESRHRAGDLLNAPSGEERTALDNARAFLREELRAGPLAAGELEKRAAGAGLAWRTVQRAADRMGLNRRKDGFDGPWLWSLPPQDANTQESGALGAGTGRKPASRKGLPEDARHPPGLASSRLPPDLQADLDRALGGAA